MSKGIGLLKSFKLVDGEESLPLQNNQTDIQNIYYDTRLIANGNQGLFIDLAPEVAQSLTNLKEAYNKGVRNFIIQQHLTHFLSDNIALNNCSIAISTNPLRTLQRFAKQHREKFPTIPVIGITGSNGKTIVKEWLYQLLSQTHNVYRSPLSFNSQLGVAVSVLGIRDNLNIAIIEAGISHPKEMSTLEAIIQPTIGIFTMIGEAHQSNFQSLQQKIEEKIKLFSHCHTIIYHSKYDEIKTNLEKAKQNGLLLNNCKLIGVETNEHLFINDTVNNPSAIENAQLCFASIQHGLGLDIEPYKESIKQLNQLPLRLEILAGKNNCTLLNDTYSADVQSLKIAVEVLHQQNQHPNKLIILGDFEEQETASLYNNINQIVKDTPLLLVGDGLQTKLSSSNIIGCFPTATDVINYLQSHPIKDASILIKGARNQHLETIADALIKQKHLTCLEINLSAMERNLKAYRSILQPTTKLMVVVKALSYGSGSFEIANMLQHQKVDYIAVAYSDEGAHLRQHGITLPIMVMNPSHSTNQSLIDYQLEPEIYSLEQLTSLIDTLNKKQTTEPHPIHLKLDTGMNRLGFKEEDIAPLIKILERSKDIISITSIMTHLSSAEDENEDNFTLQQFELFNNWYKTITQAIGYTPIRHVLNSAGIGRWTGYQMEMVRLGVGLHGIDPSDVISSQLELTTQWLTYISQIKTLQAGESIGYNRSFIATKPIKIAIIEVGYADGLRRSLSNGKYAVLVNGKYAHIIGKICMDMCMINITDVPCLEGDEVIIFGKGNPVQNLAKAMDTIPYEVLTNISTRVKRVYIRE
jgi:alanine racemase